MDVDQFVTQNLSPNQSPIKTIIVDDEKLARDLLRAWISKHPQLNIVAEFASGSEASNWLAAHTADLILLDIQMPSMSGVELAETLSQQENMPYIIFCTAYQQHAIKAFELSAVDYLVKPLGKERFHQAIHKVIKHYRQKQVCDLAQQLITVTQSFTPKHSEHETTAQNDAENSIDVKRGDELIQLLPSEIYWVEAASQYVYLHSEQGRFMLSETLSSFSIHLPQELFIRVHRSALVNSQRIQKVIQKPNKLYALVMQNGQTIPIARSRKDLLPVLIRYAKQSQSSINHHQMNLS